MSLNPRPALRSDIRCDDCPASFGKYATTASMALLLSSEILLMDNSAKHLDQLIISQMNLFAQDLL
jgi:hypothetical protein